MNDKTHEIESRTSVDNEHDQHPLYVMMTIGDSNESYKRYWNGWVAKIFTPDQIEELIKNKRATERDLQPLTEYEEQDIINALNERCKHNEKMWHDWKQSIIKALDEHDIEPQTQKEELNFADCQLPLIRCDGFIFPMSVDFKEAKFTGCRSSFRKAKFLGEAVFYHAEFATRIDFSEAVFSGETTFNEAIFFDHAYFTKAKFSNKIKFEKTKFALWPVFANAKFESSTRFTEAVFKKKPPVFYGAALHEDTDWRGIKWPDIPKNDIERAGDSRRAYECLKLIMAQQNKFPEEHFFQRLEFECREAEAPFSLKSSWEAIREFILLSVKQGWETVKSIRKVINIRRCWQETGEIFSLDEKRDWEPVKEKIKSCRQAIEKVFLSLIKRYWRNVKKNWKKADEKISLPTFFSRFYGGTSDYGWSIGRPLLGLTIIWLVGVLLIWPLGSEDVGFFQSMETSFNSIIPLPGLSAYSHEELKYLSTGLKIIYYFQTILGFVFLFLLGLGLRNRFRIK